MKHLRPCVTALLATLLAACTCLTVKNVKVHKDAVGVRFSLPEPIIAFSPKGDGTVEVTTEYLPDEDNTFALDSTVIVASGTTDVTVENGMLKAVSWNGDATAIANQLADTGGNLAKSVGDARVAAAQEQAKVDAAQEAELIKLREDRTALMAELDALNTSGADPSKLNEIAAEIAALDARIAFRSGAAPASLPANAPENRSALAPGVAQNAEKVWGPVFYRIVDDGAKDVRLEALDWGVVSSHQLLFETTRLPKQEARAKSMSPRGSAPLDRPAGGGPRRFTLVVDGPIESASALALRRLSPNPDNNIDPSTILDVSRSGQIIQVIVRDGVRLGLYELTVRGTRKDNTYLDHPIRFRVQ
jgi:hypothetical protein